MSKYYVFVLSLIIFIAFLAPAKAMTIDEAIKEMALVMQKSVPQRLSENMSLVQVSHVANTITLSYVIHRPYDQLKEYIGELRRLEHTEKSATLCSNKDPRWILDHGGIYNFIFTSEDAHFLYSYDISKLDC